MSTYVFDIAQVKNNFIAYLKTQLVAPGTPFTNTSIQSFPGVFNDTFLQTLSTPNFPALYVGVLENALVPEQSQSTYRLTYVLSIITKQSNKLSAEDMAWGVYSVLVPVLNNYSPSYAVDNGKVEGAAVLDARSILGGSSYNKTQPLNALILAVRCSMLVDIALREPLTTEPALGDPINAIYVDTFERYFGTSEAPAGVDTSEPTDLINEQQDIPQP